MNKKEKSYVTSCCLWAFMTFVILGGLFLWYVVEFVIDDLTGP